MITALIPARGGSKGVPGKNLRRLAGQSLLARCIETCRAVVGDVLVSTDSEAIAAEARLYRARVHMRPAELARDDTPTWPVVADALPEISARVIVLVQCTAPFLTPGDIRNCLLKLHECDVAVACHESHDLLLDAGGVPKNWDLPPPRRQEMSQYVVSGSVWAFRREAAQRHEYEGKLGVVLSESRRRVDIDTEDDLTLAAAMIDRMQCPDDRALRMLTG